MSSHDPVRMTLSPIAVLRAVRSLWRRDGAILLPLAGLFLFVPQWAILMLVPAAPIIPQGSPTPEVLAAWSQVFATWLAANAPAYGIAVLATQFGSLAIAALYVGRGAGQAGSAMRRAAALIGRFLLAAVALWAGPMLVLGMLVAAGGALVGMVAMSAVTLILIAVMMLLGPAVTAERGGGLSAVASSWRVTRGHRAALFALAAGVTVTVQIASGALLRLSGALRVGGADNPVVLAVLTAAAAALLAGGTATLALAGVVAYRTLDR